MIRLGFAASLAPKAGLIEIPSQNYGFYRDSGAEKRVSWEAGAETSNDRSHSICLIECNHTSSLQFSPPPIPGWQSPL
jgi:carbamoylphosphate synthase small subunit